MTSFKLATILMFITFSLSSCLREFIPDFEDGERKIVVNSFVHNEEEIMVSVTKSMFPGEAFFLDELEDATVQLYEDGSYIQDLIYEKQDTSPIGYFKTSNVLAAPDLRYDIKVKNVGFKDALGVASIPMGADIANATASAVGNNSSYNFYFTFVDAPESNYYYLKLYFKAFTINQQSGERVYTKPEIVEIPEGAIPTGQRYLDNGYIFTDENLSEGENIITGIAKAGIVPDFSDSKPDSIFLDTSKLYIFLETLSEDAFKFYSSHAKNLFSETDFFTESNPIYTNIEGGLGIFAGIYKSNVGVEVD